MENNIQKMYCDLNDLLEDICKFLSGEKLGILSSKDKKIAEKLIERSKVQLQEITRIQQQHNEEYVDMDVKKDDTCSNSETSYIDASTIYPYKDLPAKETSMEVKYGEVFMRRRFILGFEKMKKVYATIHNGWLLIYCTVKELKPLCMFDLKIHEAKEGDNEKCCSFEMTRTEDKKVYFFIAQTSKDMKQWVAEINKCYQGNVIGGDNNDVEEENDAEEYYVSIQPQDNSSNKNNDIEEEEEEDIYFELDMVKPIPQNNNSIIPEMKNEVRPPLPGRRPLLRNVGIPVPPPMVKSLPSTRQNSDSSLVSYDDIQTKEVVENAGEEPRDDTFSESDNEDSVYESFVDVEKIKNQNAKNNLPLGVKSVEVLQDKLSPEKTPNNPVLPLKPKVKEKPPVAPKKNLFGTFSTSRQYNFKNH